MIVKNCFGKEIALNRYSKIILKTRGDDWKGSAPKYIVAAESDLVAIWDGNAMTNQVILEEFEDYEAAKRAKIKYERCLQNISSTDR